MRCIVLIFCCTGLVFCALSPLCAQQPSEESQAATQQQVERLDQHIEQIRQQEQAALKKYETINKEVMDLKLQKLVITKQLESSSLSLEQLKKQIKEQQQTAQKALTTREEANQAIIAAQKAAEEAAKKLEAARKQAEAASKQAQEAKQQIATATQKQQSLQKEIEQLTRQQAEKTPLITQADTRLAAAMKQTQAIVSERKAQEQSIETLLKQSGQWVSFAQEIAPIFHSRCLACHNSRSAKGQYNMENYAAIMSPGESGEAVLPGDPDSSLLWILIDDGSMPKDADPLTDTQRQTIHRWIQFGARLDSSADPNQALIQLMPRITQPKAPEVYPAPVAITALAASTDGKLLASSGYHEVLLWSLPEGQLQRRITNVAETVYDLAFHPQTNQLAVASGTPGQLGEVKLFDTASGTLLADLAVSPDAIFCLEFSPDGSRLAAAGADWSIRIFDLKSASQSHSINVHADWVTDVSWSPDGQQLATASRDKTAKIIDITTGNVLTTFPAHQQPVTQVQFLSDGQQALSSGNDHRVRLWQTKTGKETRSLKDFRGEIARLQQLSEQHLLTAGEDKQIRLHNLSDGKLLKTFETGFSWHTSLTALPSRDILITGTLQGDIQLFNLKTGEKLNQWTASPGFNK